MYACIICVCVCVFNRPKIPIHDTRLCKPLTIPVYHKIVLLIILLANASDTISLDCCKHFEATIKGLTFYFYFICM